MGSGQDNGTAPVIVVVSGYFNPLHVGHLGLFEAAVRLGDRLVVIVNNDVQQLRKKGKIIQRCPDRMLIVSHLRLVDEVFESIDVDDTVRDSLRSIRLRYPGRLVFANGGDRSDVSTCSELAVCQELGIECVGGVGGVHKLDSSSRLNEALGVG